MNDNLKQQLAAYLLTENPNLSPDQIARITVSVQDVIYAELVNIAPPIPAVGGRP